MRKILTIYIFSIFLACVHNISMASALVVKRVHFEVVSNNPQIEVLAYPNPFKEVINLEITAHNCHPTVLKVYDIIGVERISIDLSEFSSPSNFKIQIKDLTEGIYFCNLYSHTKLIDSKKIICTK